MYYPELETLEKMNLDDCDLVPIKKEIYSDMITPIELMRKLKQYSKHVYMLESHEDKSKWGRYTFIGFDPKSEITCYNKMMKVNDKIFKVEHPKEYIRKVLNENRSLKLEGFPTFTGDWLVILVLIILNTVSLQLLKIKRIMVLMMLI